MFTIKLEAMTLADLKKKVLNILESFGDTAAVETGSPLTKEQMDAVVEDNARDAVKAELDAMGIKYGAKQRTQYLKELLEREKTKAAAQPEQMELPLETPKPATTDKVLVTIETVREVMKAFALDKGVDKAKAIITKYGSDKLSGLAPDKLTALYAEVTQAKAGEAMFG